MVALNAYQSALVQELQDAGVDFLVIGGRAMQGHGIERKTSDLDIFVSRSGDNPERLYPIVHDFASYFEMVFESVSFGSHIYFSFA